MVVHSALVKVGLNKEREKSLREKVPTIGRNQGGLKVNTIEGGFAMARRNRTFKLLCAGIALSLGFVSDGDIAGLTQGRAVSEAQARVGRPLTPVSAAGVVRRTTRRTIVRTSYYVAALPVGCVVTHIEGVSVWHCGAHYYQTYGGRYVRVTIH